MLFTLSKIFKVNERPDSMSKKSQSKQLLELLTEAEALIFLPPDAKNRSEKILILGKTEGKKERRGAKDEMVGWHHRLNGLEFEQTLGDSGGQRNLACCSPWGHKESDTT